MDTFKALRAILSFLEAAMKVDDFPLDDFKASNFGINEAHFAASLKMLLDDGCIAGVSFTPVLGQTKPKLEITLPALTLRGLQYLHENEMMIKAGRSRQVSVLR